MIISSASASFFTVKLPVNLRFQHLILWKSSWFNKPLNKFINEQWPVVGGQAFAAGCEVASQEEEKEPEQAE
jgi:hypothetical protein